MVFRWCELRAVSCFFLSKYGTVHITVLPLLRCLPNQFSTGAPALVVPISCSWVQAWGPAPICHRDLSKLPIGPRAIALPCCSRFLCQCLLCTLLNRSVLRFVVCERLLGYHAIRTRPSWNRYCTLYVRYSFTSLFWRCISFLHRFVTSFGRDTFNLTMYTLAGFCFVSRLLRILYRPFSEPFIQFLFLSVKVDARESLLVRR